jgi:transposase InsO family protein
VGFTPRGMLFGIFVRSKALFCGLLEPVISLPAVEGGSQFFSVRGARSAGLQTGCRVGVPEHLRSDNGPEFVARDLRKWLAGTGAKTVYIEPASPWENGYCESFNSKLRDEFLDGEIFYSVKEIRVLAERWRVHYNTIRPHSSLGYRATGTGGPTA